MKTSLTEEEFSIIKESLQRELALSEAKLNLIEEEIKKLEKRYGISSEEFVNKFEEGKLGDAQDFFEWWGLVRGVKKIKEQVGKIKAVLSS